MRRLLSCNSPAVSGASGLRTSLGCELYIILEKKSEVPDAAASEAAVRWEALMSVPVTLFLSVWSLSHQDLLFLPWQEHQVTRR